MRLKLCVCACVEERERTRDKKICAENCRKKGIKKKENEHILKKKERKK